MAINVPVKNITLPQHLAAFLFTDRTTNNRTKMEVYTGWVGVNFYGGDGSVHREQAVSFVLLDNLVIQPYKEDDLLDVTVTVAPSAVADDDDEANVAAVDDASVQIEPQTFAGVGGTVHCLVLRTTVAALNATLHEITYQGTVLTKSREDLQPLQLDPNVSLR
jgi:hypothetical protein